jgi:DNA-binding PadR family transcriptional regulator
MIRVLILFWLNIKPTHGYEIQKYLQVSGTEQWAKIQSGSIYYALAKMEKEEYIKVLKEERTGSRVRKIYEITESGKEELIKEIKEELATPISNIGSLKFLIYSVLCELPKEDITLIVEKHIEGLKEQLLYWRKWREIKTNEQTLRLQVLSFDIAIHNLDNQIEWHEELINNLELYISQSHMIKNYIKTFDFTDIITEKPLSELEEKIVYTEKLKNEILKDPKSAINNLDRILEELKSQIVS